MLDRRQLCMLEVPHGLIGYFPDQQPPGATGPFEWGAYSASLAEPATSSDTRPRIVGHGATENEAIRSLARELVVATCAYVATPTALGAAAQVDRASRLLTFDRFVAYLAEHADEYAWLGLPSAWERVER